MFQQKRLIFREAGPDSQPEYFRGLESDFQSPKLPSLKEQIDAGLNVSESADFENPAYTFTLGEIIPSENGKIPEEIEDWIREIVEKKSLETGNVHLSLEGVSDKASFRTIKDPPGYIDLEGRPKEWIDIFEEALDAMRQDEELKVLLGHLDSNSYQEFEESMTVVGINAIHGLDIKDQQLVMQHALAHIRAKHLGEALKKEFGDRVTFEITTRWDQTPGVRQANILGASYASREIYEQKLQDAPPPPPPTEEESPIPQLRPIKKGEPIPGLPVLKPIKKDKAKE